MDKKLLSFEDDTLMMTEDLVDLLDPGSLKQAIPVNQNLVDVDGEKIQFYDHTSTSTRGLTASVTVDFGEDEKLSFDGILQLISFGPEGWRINVDGVNSQLCITLVKLSSKIQSITIDNIVKLNKNVDVTIHFGNIDETCMMSIAADNGDTI